MPRPSELPDYRKPPIDEVASGLQFDPIPGFTDVHTGLFWQRVREEYPQTESRPGADVAIDDLQDPPLPPNPVFEFVLSSDRPGRSGRTWLITHDDSRLLQVQDSQLMHNWRFRGTEYPHLDALLDRFWSGFDTFCSFLEDESLPGPNLRQLELSYFNWIPSLPTSSFFRPAAAAESTASSLQLAQNELRFAARYLDVEDEQRVGRLVVECQPAFRLIENEGTVGNRLVLSYKSPLAMGMSRSQINERFERGRSVIVTAFTSLTTDEAQKVWERYK